MTISAQNGVSLTEPEIVLRGVPLTENEETFAEDARAEINESLANAAKHDILDTEVVEKKLHDDLAEFVYRRLRRRPMILAIVVAI